MGILLGKLQSLYELSPAQDSELRVKVAVYMILPQEFKPQARSLRRYLREVSSMNLSSKRVFWELKFPASNYEANLSQPVFASNNGLGIIDMPKVSLSILSTAS